MEVKEIAAFQLACAKKILQEQGSLMPVAFIVGAGAVKSILGVPFTSDEQKALVCLAIGAQAKTLNADYAIFLNEVYYRQVDKTKIKDSTDLELERPCYYPDTMKKEGIIVMIVDFKNQKAEASLTLFKKENETYIFEPCSAFAYGEGGIPEDILKGYKKGEGQTL
jgi:hypothetical protein